MRILVMGSLNLDHTYQVDHILKEKETLSSTSHTLFCGGKGLNQTIAIKKAGGEVWMSGCIGTDGKILKDMLKEHSVPLTFIKETEGSSGHAIIQVDKNGQNCILVHAGSNHALNESQIKETLSQFEEGDILVLQNEILHLELILNTAAQQKMKVVLNPSPIDETIEKINLSQVDTLIVNETEGEILTGFDDPEKILQALPQKNILLTLGEKGSYLKTETECLFQPALKVKAIDTVGAGDTFLGYYVAGLQQGLQNKMNLSRAALAASLAVQRTGASSSVPELQEVENILKDDTL